MPLRGLSSQVMDKSLASVPVHQNLWGLLEMDNSFTSPPNVTADSITISSRAGFRLLPNGTEVPVFLFPMPDTVNNDMVQVIISDTVPNDALNLVYTTGLWTAELSKEVGLLHLRPWFFPIGLV
jgi:hypothetical protein